GTSGTTVLKSIFRLGRRSAGSSEKTTSPATSVSADVPHTRLSPLDVPQTMLSPSRRAVPQTMLSPSIAVPHTTLSPSEVPHMMLSQSAPPQSVPHTTLSPSREVPHTMLSPATENDVPHTMLSPVLVSVFADPHTVVVGQAFPVGLMMPPVSRCEPQMIWRLQFSPNGSLEPLFAVAKKRAS